MQNAVEYESGEGGMDQEFGRRDPCGGLNGCTVEVVKRERST
jgi:hypothetical protein